MVFIRDYSTRTVAICGESRLDTTQKSKVPHITEVEQVEEESALHFAFELQDNLSQP